MPLFLGDFFGRKSSHIFPLLFSPFSVFNFIFRCGAKGHFAADCFNFGEGKFDILDDPPEEENPGANSDGRGLGGMGPLTGVVLKKGFGPQLIGDLKMMVQKDDEEKVKEKVQIFFLRIFLTLVFRKNTNTKNPKNTQRNEREVVLAVAVTAAAKAAITKNTKKKEKQNRKIYCFGAKFL